MSTSGLPIDGFDAARDPHIPLSETKSLSIGHEQLTESAVDAKVGPDDIGHSVQDPVQKDQGPPGSRNGISANIDGIRAQAQGITSGSISNSTTGAALQATYHNANDHEQTTNESKSSPHTNEDIWNTMNELKSSVDHMLFGIATLTHHVKPGHPSTRDPTVMPLIASKQDGVRVTLWAKMDTGADKNFISPSLVAKLGRNSEVEEHDGGLIHEMHGETFAIKHSIRIEFFAGLSNQHFSETFYIIDPGAGSEETDPAGNASIANESATGDLPDILLGGPFLKHSHALITDPDFENPANPEYEVLVDPPPAGRESCYIGHSRALVKHPAPAHPIRR